MFELLVNVCYYNHLFALVLYVTYYSTNYLNILYIVFSLYPFSYQTQHTQTLPILPMHVKKMNVRIQVGQTSSVLVKYDD